MYPSLSEVCKKALELPCSPALLPRLNAVVANPDAGVDEVESVLRIDPVLAASTIRLANSAYFSSSSQAAVESVGEAVMRLGLREVYRLAALALAGRWMTLDVDGYRWEPGDFFRVSLITAVAAEELAGSTRGVDPAQAYTAGLMSEIGKLAVAYSCGAAFADIRQRQRETGCTWLEAEQAILGFNHARVGAHLLREWKFPDRYAVVAEHNPPGAGLPEEFQALSAHVHAAKYVACTIGPGQGEDGFLFTLNTELLSAHGLSAELVEHAMLPIIERVEKVLRDRLATGRIKI
jgi:HD-like signal output (HDOD) protein